MVRALSWIACLAWLSKSAAAYTPTIDNPNAPNAQTNCPGYTAINVSTTSNGLTGALVLAGGPCNVYGSDVDVLRLNVEYQDQHRLAVSIEPMYMVRN